jgi:hypothetical protein
LYIGVTFLLHGMGPVPVQEITVGAELFFNTHEKARLIRPGFLAAAVKLFV